MDVDNILKLKVCLIGNTNVGKSSILHRINHSDLHSCEKNHPTIGAGFLSMITNIDGHEINFHIWDTAGQERFESLVPLYFRETKIYMVVFDMNNYDSWKNVDRWIDMINEHSNTNNEDVFAIVLIGNKNDLPSNVPQKEIDDYITEKGINYTSVSAKTMKTQEIVDQCISVGYLQYSKELAKNPQLNENESGNGSTNSTNSIRLDTSKKTKCSNTIKCAK